MRGRFKNIVGQRGISREALAFLVRILFVPVIFVSLVGSKNVLAQNIYIVPSKPVGPHIQVANGVRTRLEGGLAGEHKVIVVKLNGDSMPAIDAKKEDYIVTVGSKAFSLVLSLNTNAKILATLIPSETYRILLQKHSRKAGITSAIYIEQPVMRSLNLVKTALPGKTPGVLVGGHLRGLYDRIKRTSSELKLHVYLKQFQETENLVSAMDQVLKNCGVFVAFADPEVSNATTARHLLLTSYRYGIPVVAYSRAYVHAGALMAVYTTPEQFAQQTAEILIHNIRSKVSNLPLPVYPEYFSIDINENVARSLGIQLQKKSVLESRLKSLERVGDE